MMEVYSHSACLLANHNPLVVVSIRLTEYLLICMSLMTERKIDMAKKFLSLFLALAMVMSLSVTAFAAEEEITVIELDPETVVFAEEVIGTPADQTGEILEDSSANTRATNTTLFSMTANQVYNLLTTYNSSGKYFWGQNVKYNQAIRISGTVSMSQGANYYVRVGVCYYNPSTDTFISVGNSDFESGVYSTIRLDQYRNGNIMSDPRFFSQEKYYGHITNLYTGGYAYGTLTFSLVDNPNA